MSESRASEIGPPSAVEAILLDYGGTLDGDAAHWFDHFFALYAACGAALSQDMLRPAFYDADARLTAEPDIRRYGLERMVRTHVRFQLEYMQRRDLDLRHRLATAFIHDTRRSWERNRPLVRRLAERFRLGVISNSYGNMPALLEEAALGPFDVVIDSAIEGIAKPDPALYALAADRLALAPSKILHVGDSWERDVVPAAAAGMHVGWLALPTSLMPVSGPAVWRLASLLDLEALLQ